jgi:hypothetical protein
MVRIKTFLANILLFHQFSVALLPQCLACFLPVLWIRIQYQRCTYTKHKLGMLSSSVLDPAPVFLARPYLDPENSFCIRSISETEYDLLDIKIFIKFCKFVL